MIKEDIDTDINSTHASLDPPYSIAFRRVFSWTAAIMSIVLIMFGIWLYRYIAYWQNRPHVLEVHIFDTPGAMTLFMRTPAGHTILVDGGKSDAVLKQLASVMPFYSHSIDTLILTDTDDSHATGLVSVLGRYAVSQIIEMKKANRIFSKPATISAVSAAASSSNQAYDSFEKIILSKNSSRKDAIGDMYLEKGISMHFIFPDPPDASLMGQPLPYAFSKTNQPTLSFEIVYASTTLFFGGDLTKSEQKYLALNYLSTSSDEDPLALSSTTIKNSLLVLPHGLNIGGSDENFINKINPAYIVVSKIVHKNSSVGSDVPATLNTTGLTNTEYGIATKKSGVKNHAIKKPPFSIADLVSAQVINVAQTNTEDKDKAGEIEFISDGNTFTEPP